MRKNKAILLLLVISVSALFVSCSMILPVKQIWTYTSPSGYTRQLVISADYIQFIDYYPGDRPRADALVPYSFSEDGKISLTYKRGAIFLEEVAIHIELIDEDSLILTETVGGFSDIFEYTLDEETGDFIEDYYAERSDSDDQVDRFGELVNESYMFLHYNKTFRWVGYTPSHKEVLLASGTFVYDDEDPEYPKLYLTVSYKYQNLWPTRVPTEFDVEIYGTNYVLRSLPDEDFIFGY